MRKVLGIILKSVLLPIISIVLLKYFNLFQYITIIPEDKQFEFGVAAYLAVLETICGFALEFFDNQRAQIECVFYSQGIDRNIDNTPFITCDETMGVASIKCFITLSGNIKRLKDCNIEMSLPSWLDSQISRNEDLLEYNEHKLVWKFNKLLPVGNNGNQAIEYDVKLSFIKNVSADNRTILLTPEMKKSLGIKFKTNSFKVRNGV